MRTRNRLFGVIVLMSTICGTLQAQTTAPATRPGGPARWEEAIAKFEEQDRLAPPPTDAVLFVGSSSIRGWRLNEHFPDLPAINRGFGGSQIADSLHFADRIVLPYRPRVIVFYAGENDIAAGKSPQEVAGDFERFIEVVRADLPDTRVIFIGLKPSPSRWRMIDQFRETNALIQAVIERHDAVTFIDAESVMLDDAGEPRDELYLADQLHMTPAGYALWAELVRPHLGGAAPATKPTRDGAAENATGADALLDSVRAAYANLQNVRLDGVYALDVDAAGHRQSHRAEFTSAAAGQRKFRHEMTGDALIVCDGEKAWLYVPEANRYAQVELPDDGPAGAALGGPIERVLREQNLSLFLALCEDAARDLTGVAAAVRLETDQVIDGSTYRALVVEQDDRDLRVLIDPRTHLIRRIEVDLRKALEAKAIPAVKSARVVVDYGRVESVAAIDEAMFGWSPPVDAVPAREASPTVTRPDPHALLGKPAPPFTLKDLDDKMISLAQFKGSVVVLDFWATWCGPCRAAMPHLEQIHQDFTDQGVTVLAINLREDKLTARKFMEHNRLTLPVLLDSTGVVAGQYGVSGIPQTVVVGKSGAIRKVFVGFGPGGEKQLRDAVEQAVAE